MKIIFVHDIPLSLLNNNGDLQNSILSVSSLCQALTGFNHSVTLALPVINHDQIALNNWFRATLADHFDFYVVPLKTNPKKARVYKYFISNEIFEMIRISKPDLIITRSPIWALYLKKFGTELIIDIHSHRFSRFRILDKYLFRRLSKNIGPGKKIRIISISKKLSEYLIDKGISSSFITVAHNGFDENWFSDIYNKKELREMLNLPVTGKIALYAGSFWPSRGVGLLLEVAKLIPDINFIMIGGPENFRISLLQKIESMEIHNVNILSSMSRKKLTDYLFAVDVLVGIFSSKILTAEYFSSLKLIEYLATGIPVVTQNYASVLEIITEGVTGYIAEPDSSESLKNKIMEVLDDPASFQVGLNARQMAYEQLTWEQRAKKFLDSFALQ